MYGWGEAYDVFGYCEGGRLEWERLLVKMKEQRVMMERQFQALVVGIGGGSRGVLVFTEQLSIRFHLDIFEVGVLDGNAY